MTEGQKGKRLKERLRAEYQTCIRTLMAKLPPDLMEQAAGIAAAALVYQQLHENGWSGEFLDYLLPFENPLEKVKDMYLQEQEGIPREGFCQLSGEEQAQEVKGC